MRIPLLLVFLAATTSAIPNNLMALADGNTVFFRTRTGIVNNSGFKLTRLPGGAVDVVPSTAFLADMNDAGTIEAVSTYFWEKACGTPGSSCFLAPSCTGGFSVAAAGVYSPVRGRAKDTFVRLDGSGKLAWIEQATGCTVVLPEPTLAPGLYNTETMLPVTAAGVTVPAGFVLANRGVGRRMVVESRGALLRGNGGRLQWWSPARGSDPLQHRDPAIEAVTDATGCHIVYRTTGSTRWLDCRDPGVDDDLGFTSDMAALSSDGRMLAYRNASFELAVYDRATRTSVTGLLPPTVSSIESLAIGGERSLFVSTNGAGLLHMDLYSGEVTTLLPDLPELAPVSAKPALYIACPLPCYGPVEPVYLVSPGARLAVGAAGGRKLAAEWTWTLGGTSIPQETFQVPYGISGCQVASLTHPDLPWFTLRFTIWPQPNEVACLGAYFLDGYRGVTAENPAKVGDSIAVFVTGLTGVQPVKFQEPNPEDVAVANPPSLAEPGAVEVLRFVLHPGDIGTQRLDLKILRPFAQDQLFDPWRVSQHQCAPPPVAR